MLRSLAMPADPTRDPVPQSRRRLWIGVAALGCVSVLATAPGLTGGFVHDDLNMVGNPHYAAADDLWRAFVRHSGDYANSAPDGDGATSQTYRPITMLTLVGTHVVSPQPLAHHVVGWALHALTALCLWLALRRSDPRAEASAAHAALAGLFLLHPIGVEAYVWINGRSDVVAGMFLAALLCRLASARRPSLALALSVFAITGLGSGSKETFLPAALALTLAVVFVPLAPGLVTAGVRRRLLVQFVPAVAGVAFYLLARYAILPPTAATIAGAESPFSSGAGWLFLPKLGAIASYALLSLRAATMQSLAWDLVRSLGAAEWACGGIALLVVISLARARDWLGLWLVAAAAACIVPTVLIVYAIWLGLDRYLYMPLLLLAFVAAPHLARAWTALGRISPRLAPLVAAAVLSLAAFDTFVASSAYQNQRSWLAALLQERPEDPSVLVFVAKEIGQPGARALLERLPEPPWPSAVIVPGIAVAISGGQTELANRLADYGVRHYTRDPLIVALAMRQRYDSGQLRAALDLVPSIPSRSSICPEVRRQLGFWANRGTPADRAQLIAAASDLRCERSR